MRGLLSFRASPYLPFCHHHHLHSLPHSATLRIPLPPNRRRFLSRIISSSAAPRSGASAPSSMASSATPSSANESKPFAVLFVCLGNICRSPAAEAVFRDIVSKRGLDSKFKIDSAGTIAKSRGIEVTSISRPLRLADFRDFDLILAMDMQNREDILSAFERWRFKEPLPEDGPKKVKLMCSYCRKHKESEVPDPYYGGPQGFEKVKLMCSYCRKHKESEVPDPYCGGPQGFEKVKLMCSYCRKHKESEVPDPYCGGPQGFEKVLDLLEDACEALLDKILAENSYISAL